MKKSREMTKKKGNVHFNAKHNERVLIYIAIIHNEADMGSLNHYVRQASINKSGRKSWKFKMSLIDQLWSKIEQIVEELPLSFEKVRLYQDGLPICGREVEIVSELANAGSRNHRLLLRLMNNGARIMGTESSELLIEEYALFKQVLANKRTWNPVKLDAEQKDLSYSLLKKRDEFIADRINCTLQFGETGILFLGKIHSLLDLLEKDIRVIYPFYQLF